MKKIRRLWELAVSPGEETAGPVAAAPAMRIPEIARRFWPDARPYRRWIPLGLVLIALTAAISTAEIWLFKLVVDQALVPGDIGPLVWIGLAYLGLTLLGSAVDFGDSYLRDWLSYRFTLNLRVRIFRHLHSQSLDSLDDRRLGDLIARLMDDVRSVETFVVSGVADGLSYVLRIIFFCGALFILQWQLALVALVVTPLFFFAARHFARLIKHASRESRRRTGSLTAIAEQSLANAALVQASNRQGYEVERFHAEGEGIVRAKLASSRIGSLFAPLVDLIELAGVMLVLVLGALAVAEGSLSLGGLLVFLTYLTQLYSPVQSLSQLSNDLFSATAGAERVIELLDEQPVVTDTPSATPLGPVRGRLELDGVAYTYPGAAQPALRDVSLSVEPGETVALVGPSGAGKSTLLRLALRFCDPTAGAARLDGRDLRDVTLESLRSQIALVLQETLILHDTVRANVAYGRPGASDEEIMQALRLAGAAEVVAGLPEGLDSMLGERGHRLSGGQRQRIAIARALLQDAPVLLMDEPSSSLDPAARQALLEPIRELAAERTTVIVSHDLLTVRDVDRIVVIEDGQVLESGSHEELIARGGHYGALWRDHVETPPGRGDRELVMA